MPQKLKYARLPVIGERVKVYRNLHTRRISVRAAEGVIYHAYNIVLDDVSFRVGQAGREKVLREKRKNVHAFVVGTVVSYDQNLILTDGDIISYNPYRFNYFYNKETDAEIKSTQRAFVSCSGIILSNPLI